MPTTKKRKDYNIMLFCRWKWLLFVCMYVRVVQPGICGWLGPLCTEQKPRLFRLLSTPLLRCVVVVVTAAAVAAEHQPTTAHNNNYHYYSNGNCYLPQSPPSFVSIHPPPLWRRRGKCMLIMANKMSTITSSSLFFLLSSIFMAFFPIQIYVFLYLDWAYHSFFYSF